MYNKILSNLQFNSKYLSKLHDFRAKEGKEKRIRGIGFVLVILALLVQIVAFTYTPNSSATASPNDLITGGVTSKQQVVSACTSDYHFVALVYNWYGVSCTDIANSSV